MLTPSLIAMSDGVGACVIISNPVAAPNRFERLRRRTYTSMKLSENVTETKNVVGVPIASGRREPRFCRNIERNEYDVCTPST